MPPRISDAYWDSTPEGVHTSLEACLLMVLGFHWTVSFVQGEIGKLAALGQRCALHAHCLCSQQYVYQSRSQVGYIVRWCSSRYARSPMCVVV